METDPVSFLRKIIVQNVFIPASKERNVSSSGEDKRWLFDFRRILMRSDVLVAIGDIFYGKFKDHLPFQIGGVEVAAIPLITGLVLEIKNKGTRVNGFFIRKSRKKDGLLRMIEGEIAEEKIILVDDVLNSGNSFIRQVEVLKSLGKEVHTIFAILQFRNLEYYTYFHDRGIKVVSLFTLDDFADTLGVHNFPNNIEKQISIPFNKEWYFKSEGADFFHVIPKSRPVIDNEKIYFGSDAGIFWALNQKDGSITWSYRVGLKAKGQCIFSSPALYKDSIYFGSYDGNFYALDKNTGKKKWIFMDADWLHSSPEIAPKLSLLFVGMEFGWWKKSGGITALNIETGEKVWHYITPGFIYATPTYSENFEIVVCGSENFSMYCISAKNGKLLWEYKTDGEIRGKAGIDEKRGLVVFGSLDDYIYVVDIKTGQLVRKVRTDGWPFSDIVLQENTVYVSCLSKVLYAIDLDTAEVKWKFSTKGRIFASPYIIGDKIYVGCNDARLYELDLHTGKETGFFQTTERITNGIAYNVATKKLFLPTFANEIYCLTRKV